MSFISYAPNLEDVMLWRALRHVGQGFYVDSGGAGPHEDSVTRAFYERGWHGLNLRGARALHAALLIARPADINLQVIAGPENAQVTFYDIGARSTLDETLAREFSEGGETVVQRQLPQQTLTALCAEHAPAAIHFMRLAEPAALSGLDLQRWRPWVLIVAGERVEAARYTHAYHDGISHFYVADEHPELRAAFATPPTAADDFVLRSDHPYAYPLTEWREQVARLNAAKTAAEASAQEARDWAEARVREREQQAAERERHADERERLIKEANQRAERAETLVAQRTEFYEATIAAIYQSSSWRITRPLRSLNFRLKALRVRLREWAARRRAGLQRLRARCAGALKGAVRRVVRAIMSRPKISFFVRSQIGRHPRLTNWLRVAVQRTQAAAPAASIDNPAELEQLPAAARQVLDDLRRTMKRS